MNLNLWHRVACLALLLPVLAASGCTGTDVLTPTAGNVKIEIDVSNVPEGFRFETARFRIDQITMRPVDEGANAALGTYPIGLIQDLITINFDLAAPKEALLTLHTGTYRLEEITISSINFRDLDDPPDPLPAACEDYFRRYRSGTTGGIGIREFDSDILITVLGTEDNLVRIVFDWAVFVEAMQAAWPCELCAAEWDECDSGDFGDFNESTFNNYVPDFLSVN